METDFIQVRNYVDFRTDQEEKTAKSLKKMLKQSFPHSKINLHYGSKLEIQDGNITSFLVVADNLVFRSEPGDTLQDFLNDIVRFFTEHKRNTKTDNNISLNGWYLPASQYIYSPKNRDLELYFDDFKFGNEFSFIRAYPSGRFKRGHWNYIIYQNVVSIRQFQYVLTERIKLNKWIYKMVLLFKGNVMLLNTHFLNYKEGVGDCLLRKMLLI